MCKAKEKFTKGTDVLELIDICVGKTDYYNKTESENRAIFAKRQQAIDDFYDFRFAIDKEDRDDALLMIHEKVWNHKDWAKGIAQEIHAELQNEVEKEVFCQIWDEEEIKHAKRNSGHAERRKRTATAKKRKQKALANASVYCTSEVKANGAVKSIKVNAKKPNAYKRNNRVSYVPEVETEFISAGDKLYSQLTEIETEMNRVRNLLKNLEADYNGTLTAYYDTVK